LVAGANDITDNLGLVAPFARSITVINNATGAVLTVNITAETANNFTITSGVAIPAARITVIG
jgi:hypothetical protein